MDKIYDAIIIGAGPSGITASIYLKRSGVDFLLFDNGMPGGKVNYTYQVENYLGFENINGSDLAFKLYQQLIYNKILLKTEKITLVKKEGDIFKVETNKKVYLSRTILVASGTRERKLHVEGEDKFFGKGVSTCAVCDGNFYKGQKIAVIGAGNSAFEEALYLSSLSDQVFIIHRSDTFRADQLLCQKVENNMNIHLKYPYVVKEILGDDHVSSLRLENTLSHQEEVFDCRAVFTYIGSEANTSFIEDKRILDSNGFIEVNGEMESRLEGLFASGDVTSKHLRQIAVASGDGALAATSINRYLKEKF